MRFRRGAKLDRSQVGDLRGRRVGGAPVAQYEDCRILAIVNSVQAYWERTLHGYEPAQTIFFEGGVSTACGNASSAVGPFYCPADRKVYIDLGFFDELQSRFGATGVANARRDGLIEEITRRDIQAALSAAAAVGDDRIQERSQRRVTPENWTHGSSEQRESWFVRGLEGGTPNSCDTFSGRV